MRAIRRADERGAANHGWLDARHTFSFADYMDPDHMQYRSLRVINEDRIAPGGGFPMHRHRDMEILTYVIDGALEHKDSMGNGSVIRAGQFQKMSAGSGVMHSEFNPSQSEPTHMYQIWIVPDEKGIAPSYSERPESASYEVGAWNLIAARDANGAFPLAQDASVYLGKLDAGNSLDYPIHAGRHLWLQIVKGSADLAGETLRPGDGVAVEDENEIALRAVEETDVILFDLA